MGYIDRGWLWFGNQGLSYIQLGRFWQIGFFLNLIFWSLLVFRALWPTTVALWQATRQFWTGRIRLEHLIWAVGFGSRRISWEPSAPAADDESEAAALAAWQRPTHADHPAQRSCGAKRRGDKAVEHVHHRTSSADK